MREKTIKEIEKLKKLNKVFGNYKWFQEILRNELNKLREEKE